MLRTIGFLTGCGLTALLVLALFDHGALDGLRRAATIPPQAREDVTAPQLRAVAADAPARGASTTGIPAVADDDHGPGNRARPSGPGAADDATRSGSETMGTRSPPMADPVTAESAPFVPSDGAAAGAEAAVAWHAFWTPFRSEASAAGFARHLEKVTGLEYRVVKAGPGVYRVAFRHAGDDERTRRLLAIERASGLKLRHGTL
jgi:hypothetical protein